MNRCFVLLFICLLGFAPVTATERAYFGGLTDEPANRIISRTTTLIALDSTAESSGTVVEIRTHFDTAGVTFRARVFRSAGTDQFEVVGESQEMVSEAGFHSYTTEIPGVQQGDYMGMVSYLGARDTMRVARARGLSSYYYFAGDHASGVETYVYVPSTATITIAGRIGLPATATQRQHFLRLSRRRPQSR